MLSVMWCLARKKEAQTEDEQVSSFVGHRVLRSFDNVVYGPWSFPFVLGRTLRRWDTVADGGTSVPKDKNLEKIV